MSDHLAIQTTDLWKRYDDVEALRGLNLQVPAGSICGFLGRNGAGKTTAIKVLLGMARPTAGTARRPFPTAYAPAEPPGTRPLQRRRSGRTRRTHEFFRNPGEKVPATRSAEGLAGRYCSCSTVAAGARQMTAPQAQHDVVAFLSTPQAYGLAQGAACSWRVPATWTWSRAWVRPWSQMASWTP